MLIPFFEVIALACHTLSFFTGFWLVHKNKSIFTREDIDFPRESKIDFVEILYFTVVISITSNLWYTTKQVNFMLEGQESFFEVVDYLQWMGYHTVTGICFTVFHIFSHRLLKHEKHKGKIPWKP